MRTILLSIVVLLSSSVFGQNENEQWRTKTTYSLSECVEYALKSNLNVAEFELNNELLDINHTESKMQMYPNVNSSMGWNNNFGRTIDPFTNQFVNSSILSNNFSLSAGMVLYNGSRIRNSIANAKNQIEKGTYDLGKIKNDISLAVVNAYLNIIFADQQVETIEQQKENTRTQLERTTKLVEGGRLNRSEMLNLKAQLASDDLRLTNAQGNLTSAYMAMKQLLQYPVDLPFQIEIPTINEPNLNRFEDQATVVESSLKSLPEMQSARAQQEINLMNEKITKAGLYPQLAVFANVNTLFTESRLERFNEQSSTAPIGFVEGTGQSVLTEFSTYDTRTSPFGTQLKDNFGQSVGLSLSIPIFNNYRTKSAIQRVQLEQKRSELNLNRTENQVRMDITNAYIDHENAVVSYVAAKENEAAQKESYNFSEKRFNSGLITSAELLVVKNNWMNSVIDLNRAKFQLIFTNSRLEFYRSGTIDLSL